MSKDVSGQDLSSYDPSSQPTSRWLLVAIVLLLAAAGVPIALWRRAQSQPGEKSLEGKLTVLVRGPNRNLEPVSVFEPGAAPVKSGGAMCLDVALNQPAFIYLVWFDAAGKISPLYPWNNERLEVTDVNQPPPLRRAGKLVFSPLLGGNWTFGNQAGTETVVLLTTRQPLAEGTEIGKLLKSEGVPSVVGSPNEVVKVELGGAAKAKKKQCRGSLGGVFCAWAEHFELVQAVQFGHVE